MTNEHLDTIIEKAGDIAAAAASRQQGIVSQNDLPDLFAKLIEAGYEAAKQLR